MIRLGSSSSSPAFQAPNPCPMTRAQSPASGVSANGMCMSSHSQVRRAWDGSWNSTGNSALMPTIWGAVSVAGSTVTAALLGLGRDGGGGAGGDRPGLEQVPGAGMERGLDIDRGSEARLDLEAQVHELPEGRVINR